MGMTWRFIMPLLSTLAALVIIVHSAEEDADRDYRYELRPRNLDTRPSNYGQAWRLAEPISQLPATGDTWKNDQQENLPLRRRKRKRRPPADDDDDDTPRRRYSNNDDETPVNNYEESEDNVKQPRRRRKKHRYLNTGEEPIRRAQIKRPSLDPWPILSEFGNLDKDDADDSKYSARSHDDNKYYAPNDDENEDNGKGDARNKKLEVDDEYIENKEIKIHISRPKSKQTRSKELEEKKALPVIDKSLSEFSIEVMNDADDEKQNQDPEETSVKSPKGRPPLISYQNMDGTRNQAPIDPQTLKDILKKTNGTSLSEILQKHNLTLADLLNGKENAISVLRSQDLLQAPKPSLPLDKGTKEKNDKEIVLKTEKNKKENNFYGDTEINNDNADIKILNKNFTLDVREKVVVSEEKYSNQNFKNTDSLSIQSDLQIVSKNSSKTPVISAKRRFSGGIRRKLRMRPVLSNNYKSQLNRDLIALSARRYVNHSRRNTTKAKEWRDMMPLMPQLNATEETNEKNENITLTTTASSEETTTTSNVEELMQSTNTETTIIDNDVHDQTVTTETEEVETTTLVLEILESEMPPNITERPLVRPMVRNLNASGLRRQAYNNRLKKKRLQHKTSTTEPPPDDVMKNFLSMGDFVSSSEFIARTQLPKFTSPADVRETATELEDFMTTETTSQTHSDTKSKRIQGSTHKMSTKPSPITDYPVTITTEETAKIEIQEILNDTHTSAKLTKILRERNMTLGELLDHRERGSSHVHLADIFHNASREPNPPEPFLTKSLIEPISKETYPLRALLDANLHDTTTKSSSLDPNVPLTNHVTIPVTMAFGNNVNENAENMGIMSLFNNYTKGEEHTEKPILQKDSEGTIYKSTIIKVNATDDDSDTRESRMMDDDQDMVSWNEIFAMIRKHHSNESGEVNHSNEEKPLLTTQKKIMLETDVDGDGLIVLEDLQHISRVDTDVPAGSLEKVEFNSYESSEVPHDQNIPNNLHSNAKSVTITTASLVGLAMILFLLTYSALKWKQQRALSRNQNFNNDRIPSPVFENRKVKKNCSSRSISPMLPTSNIYTMNTLESQNGKDSPEYMWDTLRKPFQ